MSTSIKRKNWDGPTSQRRQPLMLLAFIVLSFLLLSLLLYIIHLNVQIVSIDSPKKNELTHTLRTLPSEIAFRLTLRDCIPKDSRTNTTKECLQQTPMGSTARQRIAIMSPESRVRTLFYEWLHHVLLILYNHDELRMNQEFELISTSHVPPYGYGGNHGYTKIIRLLRLPLSLHFIDSTESILWNSSSSSYTINDLEQVTRQVTRWHCRLSHVAAHTALFTMEITDITMSAWSELLQFLLSSSSKDETHTLLPLALLETGTIRDRILQRNQNFFEKLLMPTRGNPIAIPSKPYLDVIELALADELEITNQLRIWPCLTFWNVGDDMSQHSQFVANQLVPQCSAPFTTCVVDKDHCEEKKDPTCS